MDCELIFVAASEAPLGKRFKKTLRCKFKPFRKVVRKAIINGLKGKE
jgi:hypothetical protein